MYATLDDLVARFGAAEVTQLSDRENTGGPDAEVVARALADAQAEIDGYLAGRYRLPLATVPAALGRVACDLARYYLSVAPDETVKARYDGAVRFLQAVAKGTVNLGPDDAGSPPRATEGAQMVSGGRVFDRDRAKGFV